MEKNIKKVILIGLTGAALFAGIRCKSPYIPPASATSVNYLHIEGVINTSGDSTIITLTRTVKLTDSVNSNPELNANVTVQGNNGTSYRLNEQGNGVYYYPNFSFLNNSNSTYSLKIVTSSGKVYQSDFVPVKNSPPIDSIYYKVTGDGVQLYSNTHDPSNKTRYYRWSFDETWIVYSYFDSFFEVQRSPKDTVVARPAADQIDSCWLTGHSSTLILNSSAKLSQDVIMANPVGFVNSTSEKLISTYSILLHQFALTEDAFNYWQNLKKNTEQLGSIFDAQPSQLQGNIHCVSDPSEPVLGYLSAGSDAKKRVFVYKDQLPAWKSMTPFSGGCTLVVLPLADIVNLFQTSAVPVDGIYNAHAVLTGYDVATSPICADCSLRGSNHKPTYWISK